MTTTNTNAAPKLYRLGLAYAKARDHYNHMSWDDPDAQSAASDAMYAARDALTAFACDIDNFPSSDAPGVVFLDAAFKKKVDAEFEKFGGGFFSKKPKKPVGKKPAAVADPSHPSRRGPGRPKGSKTKVKKDAGAMAVLEQRALSKSSAKKLKAAAKKSKKPAAKKSAAKKSAAKKSAAKKSVAKKPAAKKPAAKKPAAKPAIVKKAKLPSPGKLAKVGAELRNVKAALMGDMKVVVDANKAIASANNAKLLAKLRLNSTYGRVGTPPVGHKKPAKSATKKPTKPASVAATTVGGNTREGRARRANEKRRAEQAAKVVAGAVRGDTSGDWIPQPEAKAKPASKTKPTKKAKNAKKVKKP